MTLPDRLNAETQLIANLDADIRQAERRWGLWFAVSLPPLVAAAVVLREDHELAAILLCVSLLLDSKAAYWWGWSAHAKHIRPSTKEQP